MSSALRTAGPYSDVNVYASAFEEWLLTEPTALEEAVAASASSRRQMDAMRGLMKVLYVEGWNRYGWSEGAGGLGGSIFHRGVMWESLARHGITKMCAFEHLEVLGPTLLAMAPQALVARTFPRFLDGTEVWSQGFSEPDAGSDLASIRTRALATDDGYVLTGRKIWTSWAEYAKWCLVLARTGAQESRHRGITAVAVELTSPGVEVRPIAQADGNSDLAEVTFDDVFVPSDQTVGDLDGGWAVAMHILGHERGTFAWFRQCLLNAQLLGYRTLASPENDGQLGDALLDLASIGAASAGALQSDLADSPLGPRSAFTKLMLCSAEQALYDWVLVTDTDLAIDPLDVAAAESRQHYLFSRIITIYGGSQQMQLDTVAKQILRLP